uniref:Methyltransferase FkbM domain-containing protein n=1 Tax=Ditylum brightwellii TaxID=49249 RepID=A0A7S4VGY4_9STRA|mmetsp:Transcript_60021/g.89158  ORF Transcript_60021/g.89158 Transcript_60021/m.89158 type:complete len:327 (+) Transcript_60021:239-1219(+)
MPLPRNMQKTASDSVGGEGKGKGKRGGHPIRFIPPLILLLGITVIGINMHMTHISILSLSQDDSEKLSDQERRMLFYRNRYKHTPPMKHPQNYSKVRENLCGSPPEYVSYFSQRKWVRSQFEEDKTLYNTLFQGVVNQTFVELGAFDGMHWSNSRFFEECLGWNGMLIEASPAVFPRLLTNRPHTHRLSFAPICNEANRTILFANDAKPKSAADGVIGKDSKDMVEVSCGPLGPVLEDVMGGHIALFSLDVENSEPMVLKTINWSKVKVDTWIVESINGRDNEESTNQETRDIFQSAGYTRYEGIVKNSDLYIHKTSPYQLRMPRT